MKILRLILLLFFIVCFSQAVPAQDEEVLAPVETEEALPPVETEEAVKVTPPPYLCISGLMPDGERPLAVVNEEVVEEGDVIDGARVVGISDHQVTFEYQGDNFSKSLGQGCRASQASQTTVSPPRSTASRRRPRSMPSFSSGSGGFNQLSEGQAGAMTAVFVVMWILWLVVYIYMALCLQTIATKTSTANGWFAWIPILNFYLMCQIASRPGWFMLLLFIPFVNLIVFIMIWMGIAQVCGKPSWLGILMVLPLANIIIPGYLAFSK